MRGRSGPIRSYAQAAQRARSSHPGRLTGSKRRPIFLAMDDLGLLRRTLGDSFDIQRELGGGGMSRVFLAEEKSLGRQVVIKTLPESLTAAVSAERFRREIRLAAQLQNPHIVPVLQSGEAGGMLYYTMPFVEGESVRSLIARQGALPVGRVLRVLRDVLDALVAAHARGVVHRDVKPDNILISGQHALVTDFGIAKAISASASNATLTSSGLAIGTPSYMAPEQVAGDESTDHRADLYAVGCLAYELLTGRPPFTGTSAQAVIAAQLTQVPEPVSRHRSGIPPRLADLVMRCLEKHPADRPQTAAEVLGALEMLTTGTTDERTTPPQRKRAGLVAAIGILAVVAVIFAGRSVLGRAAPDGAITSIAVLPLENQGGDSTDEYFADGMTDEIAAALGHIPTLQVAPRSSAFAFKDKQVDIREVGRQLKVASVLEGSVQRDGDSVRVRVQLTKVSDNFVLWQETYSGDVREVFALYDSIARAIASALEVHLGPAQGSLADRPTTNPEAYDLYLQGRYAWNQRTGQSLLQAAHYFEQAIARDSQFAQAHAGIAESYVLLPFYAAVRPLDEWPKAKAAALRALALDSTSAEARTALAYGTFLYEGHFTEAERGFRRAIADDPRHATAYQWFADMLGGQGRMDDRLAQLKRAQELDPLSRIFGHEIAQTLFVLGRIDEAIAELEQTLALDPTFAQAIRTLGLLYERKGRRDEAIQLLRRSLDLSGRRPIDVGQLARIYGLSGQRDSSLKLLRELEDRAKEQYIPGFALALAQIGLGNTDEAFALLNRGLDQREPSLIENWVDPSFEPLRSDPRWAQFLTRLKVVR